MKGKAKPVTGHAVGAVNTARRSRRRAPLLPLVGRELELAVAGGGGQRRAPASEPRGGDRRRAGRRQVAAGGGAHRDRRRLSVHACALRAVFGVDAVRAVSRDAPPADRRAPRRVARERGREADGVRADGDARPRAVAAFARAAVRRRGRRTPPEVDEIDPVFRRDRLHDVLDQFLARMLLMPTVLLVEDVHWLDDASQLLLAKLAQPGPRPWLVVATRRPSGLAARRSRRRWCSSCSRSARDEARTLALAAAGDVALSEEQLSAVTERAAGQPALHPRAGGRTGRRRRTAGDGRVAADDPDRHAGGERSPAAPARLGDRADLRPRSARRDPARTRRPIPNSGCGSPTSSTGPARLLRFRHDLVRTAAYDGLSYRAPARDSCARG